MNSKQSTNSKLNKISNKVNTINQKLNNTRKRRRLGIRKLGPRRFRRNKRRMIPAANIRNMNRDFKILYQDGTTVKVTGRDLVYQIPSDLTDQNGTGVITIIPANPCYWLGTRIAALAQGYQNYRPLNMKFTYIPQCAVTQQGNVIAGTLWNQAPSNVNLQQSLRTSNGGMLSQCYKGFTSNVRLKSNLQYNLYKTAGAFNQESNPFIYMAIAIGCKTTDSKQIIPGYFYVTWSFLLKNPIGNTNIFYNSGLTEYEEIEEDDNENKAIIYLTPDDDELPIGAILQLDKDEVGDVIARYNGSVYDMADDDLVWYFANSTIQEVSAIAKSQKGELVYQEKTEGDGSNIQTFSYIRESIENPQNWQITTYLQPQVVKTIQGVTYYWMYARYQELPNYKDLLYGTFKFMVNNEYMDPIGLVFEVPKSQVELLLYSDQNKNKNKTKLKNKKRLIKSETTLNIKQQQEEVINSNINNNIKQKSKQNKVMQKSNSDKYYTNISPIFETS